MDGKNTEAGGFYTPKGYHLREGRAVTEAMEDYLEMICRHTESADHIRIHVLAASLNVNPSSASKMAANLQKLGLVEREPYGVLRPTEQGRELGAYLLRRHDVLQKFFCALNGTESELRLVEQIEHYLDRDTVRNLEALTPRLAELRKRAGF